MSQTDQTEWSPLDPIKGPELVFGLVGPVGTDMKFISKILEHELKVVSYDVTNIHVTDLFDLINHDFKLDDSYMDRRYATYIAAGNELRRMLERPDAFALLSVAAIRKQRINLTGDRTKPATQRAYLLNQFKRPEEIQTLRRIYGRGFIQISAYSSKQSRLDSLTARIASSYSHEKREEFYKGKAYDLMVVDADEEDNPLGQRVRDTFPLADVVIDTTNEETAKKSCQRFIRAFFGDNFISPTIDEYGAYAAKNASLRSLDLSRQVGAVAIRPTGEILAVGCNEVPKAGGGTYWEGDLNDYRDYKLGHDPNAKIKTEILHDFFRRINKLMDKEYSNEEIDSLIKQSSDDEVNIKDSHLMDILEYGRVIHAEMSVISDAARMGVPLKGATLYVTTFPCHVCARHIVAAGIDRVVYIEPYEKSFAQELYPDSISVEGEVHRQGKKVKFEPFIGIAPSRYREIFEKGRRKNDDGLAILWEPAISEPLLQRLFPAYLHIENGVLDALVALLEIRGLQKANNDLVEDGGA